MRLGVIADVHGNAPALDRVLSKLGELSVDAIVCLGDTVGYNAHPGYCIDRIREEVDWCVLGNHDADVSRSVPECGTSPGARETQEWTRDQLDVERLGWLESLPNKVVRTPEFVAVHGCYINRSHVTGYVTGAMVDANLQAIEASEEFPALAFCGHTHIPFCAWLARGQVTERRGKDHHRWPPSVSAVLVNPGSVGQPRDGDPRSAFVVVDTDERQVTFHRAEYDIGRMVEANTEAGLPVEMGERLWVGR